jgi:predicted dehydrogenase
MTEIPVALVGYGYAGKTFHQPLIAATAGLRLVCVVSRQPDKVASDVPDAKVVPDLEAALSDPAIQLVVIASPNHCHAPQAIAAMRAGRAVVVDKPFTVTMDDARDVERVSQETGQPVFVFHNRRWDADFRLLQQWVGEGRLGQIVHFESHFDRWRPTVRDRWRERSGPGGGLWLDLGPHLIDQALLLLGAPLSVSADIAMERPGALVDDAFRVTLNYALSRAVLSASMLRADNGLRFAVHGTSGSFLKHGQGAQEDDLKAGMSPLDPAFGIDPDPAIVTTADGDILTRTELSVGRGGYLAFYAGVRDALRTGCESPVALSQAIDVMRVLELGFTSARTGRPQPWAD